MIETFRPLLDAARGVDLTEPRRACSELERRFSAKGPAALALGRALGELLASKAIANQGEMPVRYGRVAKATDATSQFSIDVVHMNGAGPRHTHPLGEVNFCIALDGEPKFDGEPPGWVVLPPGSTHVPKVEGGTMLIVYLLPQGKIQFA